MGKPSIFSREYEKKMKRRKRNIIIISLIIVLITSTFLIKVVYNPIDYKNIKKNIQAWIDSDTITSEETKTTDKETTNENKTTDEEETGNKEILKEETQKPLEKSIDITLASGNTAKAIYTEESGAGKIFKTLTTADNGVVFNISPSGKQMIITDTNSSINLYNVDGTNTIVSKDQYISSSGSVFAKEVILKEQPEYLWNVNPKFISEEKIIFVSNRPYFGKTPLKQYLWLTDIKTGEDKVFWELAGAGIEIGENEEKGIKVIVDGKTYYVDINGNCVQ